MPHKIKIEAKEVSLAIEKGLKQLGLRRDQVEVTVLENARKGFLGIGSRPAVVELRQKRWVSSNLDAQIYMDVPKKKRSSADRRFGRNGRNGRGRNNDQSSVREIKRGGRRAYGPRRGAAADKMSHENEIQQLPSLEIQNAVIPEFLKAPLQEAKDYLNNVLAHMGVKTENLQAWWDEKQQRILLTFDCDHPAIVIGKEGKTLESLQYLATLSLSRHFDKPISVIADTQNYWRKAEDKINADLEFGINQIKKGYSVYRFRPMSAQLRRYIHRAAENNEFVITVSEGEGQWRKVTLRPRPADSPIQKPVAAVEEKSQVVSAQIQPQSAVSHAVQEDTQGATCQVESARNCDEAEMQVGCACSDNLQTTQTAEQTAQPAEQAVAEPVTIPSTEAPLTTAEAQVPAPEQTVQPVSPETVIPQGTEDNAQGATCTAEIARDCSETEQQTGCACGPLFESVSEENTPEENPEK